MKNYILLPAIFLSVTLVSCKKEGTDPLTPNVVTAKLIVVSDLQSDGIGVDRFTYFRFSDSAVVAFNDSGSTKWDIAFKNTTIRTNSGSSGPGNGGAIVLKGTGFDDVSVAPTSGYGIDTASTKLAIKTGSGNGWYNYNTTTNIITPIPGVVIIVRTADGKYAKVEMLSYYKGAPATPEASSTSRFYKFKYVFGEDGSTNLK